MAEGLNMKPTIYIFNDGSVEAMNLISDYEGDPHNRHKWVVISFENHQPTIQYLDTIHNLIDLEAH